MALTPQEWRAALDGYLTATHRERFRQELGDDLRPVRVWSVLR